MNALFCQFVLVIVAYTVLYKKLCRHNDVILYYNSVSFLYLTQFGEKLYYTNSGVLFSHIMYIANFIRKQTNIVASTDHTFAWHIVV